jgi:thiamine transport system substrate-binding protein
MQLSRKFWSKSRVAGLFGVMALALAACAAPPPRVTSPTAAPSNQTNQTNQASATPQTLTVMTHDSFSVSEAVLKQFEQTNNVKVIVLKSGDAGSALNKAILSKSAPIADVLYGVDNTFLSRALAADIFVPYAAPALTNIADTLKLDKQNRLLPVDYGHVVINFDKAMGGTPATLKELADPKWKSKLVVQNPATSSPGLAFLMATIAAFPENSEYSWRQFWAELRANDVFVSPDWSDAYYTQFSGSSGKGPRPLVVSYQTSPAAEVYFSEGKLKEPPTGNLEGTAFEQIEFAGILKGAKNRALAEKFVDFLLSAPMQADIPLQMFVYPAVNSTPLPEMFTQFAPAPKRIYSLAPEAIDQNRETWIEEWTKIVLR